MSSETSQAEVHWHRIRRLVDEFDFGTRILRFVEEHYGLDVILNAWEQFIRRKIEDNEQALFEFGSRSPFAKLFISWVAHNWRPEQDLEEELDPELLQVVPTEAFLQRHPELDPLLSRYLETCTYSPLSFYEVVQGGSGKSVNCRDVVIGSEYQAFEEVAAECLKAGDIVYARLVEIDGISLLEVIAPVVFPAVLKPTIVNFRELILEGEPLPTEAGRGRQFLEDRELELRKVFWNLVYLVIGPESSLDQPRGTNAKGLLH